MKKIKDKAINWLYHSQWQWWIEGLFVGLTLFIIAIVFTWPLARHLHESIPAGSEPPAVSEFQLFTVEWTGRALEEGRSYWCAPFFYPFQGAFAWCEPQLFSSVLIWLLAKLTGYILAYNIIILLYLVGLGLTGYATARLLTHDRLAALWSAIWLTGGAYSLQQICSLPLMAAVFPTGCIFFSFLFALEKKQQQQQQRFFYLAFLFYFLTWTTCKQSALFLTILLPFLLLPFLSWRKLHWPTVINFFLALIIILALLLPYSLRQLSYTQAMGFRRILTGTTGVFRLKDLFMPAQGHWLITHILGWGNDPDFYSWDIGVVVLLVIILSICLGILRSRSMNVAQKKIIIGLSVMVSVALFLGFGPRIGIVVKGKNYGFYSFLFSIIPGLDLIRSPARFGIFVIFGIAVLSAPAWEYVKNRMNTKIAKIITALLLFFLLFLEMWTMPVTLVFPDKEIREHLGVINWLKEYGGGHPVLELPMSLRLRPIDVELDMAAMLRMLKHSSPIVNGYASFTPTPFKQLRMAMTDDPAGRGRRYIDAYGIRYVVVHNDKLSTEQQRTLQQALGNNVVYNDVKHVIYLLPGKKYIQDIRQLLPLRAKFRQRPQEEKIYGLLLSKPITETRLIMPQLEPGPEWWINFAWSDDSGKQKATKIRMRGSVLLDIAQPRLFFQILYLSKEESFAEARLISAEEVKNFLQRN